MAFPELHPDVAVDPSASDLDALWDRFEVFEAMHHSQRICNPLGEDDFGRILDAIDPVEERRWLDLGCGSGELLIRGHERGTRQSVGIDLSPWMLNAAARRASERLGAGSRPSWILGEGARVELRRPFHIVSCLGAEWIWRGMPGTINALSLRVESGGTVVYGGPRLHFDADPDATAALFGQLDTVDDVARRMGECGLEIIERFDPTEAGWLAYLDRGRENVLDWAQRHPGERAEQWIAEQQEWAELYERDRAIVGWSVWIATAPT